MSLHDSEDKNHLAMLAIPVVLSMLLGFYGDVQAMERTTTESISTESVERENRGVGNHKEVNSGITEAETKEDNRKRNILKAVDKDDYDSFVALVKNTPFAEIMTESAFRELKDQYQHSRDGSVISPLSRLR